MDIISAIPDDYKKALLPKLKARPVRTASGVSFFSFFFFLMRGENMLLIYLYFGFAKIAVVAVMCKPHRCPHIAMTGNICVYVPDDLTDSILLTLNRYCPGGPDSDFDYSTQSYTGYEPTSMRAIRARYDPYEQTRGRVEQLKSLGHSVDKV